MKVKNLFSALLVVAVFVSASFAATITPVQPTLSKSCYQIGTAAELYGFAAIVNGTDGMTRRVKACGKLTADIVVNKDVLKSDGSLNGDGSNFIPWKIIKSFSGTFDGQGHTISGLYLVDDDYESVGFIDQIVSSTYESPVIIQNLGIVNSYFEGGYVSVFVNGVYNSDSTLLRNSFSAVTIKAYQDAEGLIGWTSGSHVSIDNCFSFNKFEPGDYDMSPITRSSSGDKVARIKNSIFVDTLRSSIGGLGVSVDDFKNGMVATMLHYSANGSIWGQTVGTDPYPVFSGKLSGNIGNITTSDIALYTYLGDTAKYNLKYVEGKGVDLPAIVRTGYFFAGWYTNEDLDGDPVYSVDSTATGAKAFYAKWVHLPNLVNGCYEISNADEMYGFASITRREYRKYKSGKLCGKLVKDIVINNNVLKEDRTLNGDGKNFEVWEPFEWFKGSFDGQGHSIWGLFIKDTSRSLLGLFRAIDGDDNDTTFVKNLTIMDSYFEGNEYIGAIAGSSLSDGMFVVENCHSQATVKGQSHVGGFMGESSSWKTVLRKNSNEGLVVGSSLYTGGFIGSTHHFTAVLNVLNIDSCFNSGSIQGGSFSGGFVGEINTEYMNITNSYNTGDVSGHNHTAGLVGHITTLEGYKGRDVLNFKGVYNTGSVTGSEIASIVGSSLRSISLDNVYNKGVMHGEIGAAGLIYAISDQCELSMKESYNEGLIEASFGKVGAYCVGGLVCYIDGEGTISNSYNVGAVKSDTAIVVGGIVGEITGKVNLVNSYNMGAINVKSDLISAFAVVREENASVTIDNFYYLNGQPSSDEGKAVTSQQFADGTVFSALHGFKNDDVDGGVWKQQVGVDKYPVLDVSSFVASSYSVSKDVASSSSREKYQSYSSAESSSSQKSGMSSSSQKSGKSSSSAKSKVSSDSKTSPKTSSSRRDAIFAAVEAVPFNVIVNGKKLLVSGAHTGIDYAVVDIQGNVLKHGQVQGEYFEIEISSAGVYMFRMLGQTQMVHIAR